MTWTSLLSFILPVVCTGLILAASVHDLMTRTIPNGLALLLAVTGVTIGVAGAHLPISLLVAGAVFIITTLCWRRGWMGGGDVKLLSAAALCIPPNSALTFVAAVTVAGGLLALIYLTAGYLLRGPVPPRPYSLLTRVMRVERWRISRGGSLPYACAIAAGFLFVIL